MRKSGRIFVSVFVLLLAIVAVIAGSRGGFGRKPVSFAAGDKREITRIVMSRQGAERLILEKRDEGWIMNGGEEVRISAVNLLLRTLQSMEIKSPVSGQMFESEITNKGIEPVEVKVWSRRRVITSFLVYSTQSNSYGNIMKRNSRSDPYILSVPGYRWQIATHFNTDKRFWTPFNIFTMNPAQIKTVELLYRDASDDSFLVANPFIPEAEQQSAVQKPENPDRAIVQRYFSYFVWVPLESYALDLPAEQEQAIRSSEPFATITVRNLDETRGKLYLWERMVPEGDGFTTDNYRVWGMTEERQQLFIVRYFDIDPLLRRRSYFVQRE